jgi:hypothetical protein
MFLFLLFIASSLIFNFKYALFIPEIPAVFPTDCTHLFLLDSVTVVIYLLYLDLIILNILYQAIAYASSVYSIIEYLCLKFQYSHY